MFFIGASIFLVGSTACGFTWVFNRWAFNCALSRGMVSLIVFRTFQGLGAGAIQSIATTIIGDIYPGRAGAAARLAFQRLGAGGGDRSGAWRLHRGAPALGFRVLDQSADRHRRDCAHGFVSTSSSSRERTRSTCSDRPC